MSQVTRRRFLKGSLAGGLAISLPFSRAIGANDDVRVAVVGLGEVGGPGVGARGRQLINEIRKVPGVRITALCDVDTKILAREVERFEGWQEKVKTYAEMRHVFDAKDIDAVFVATPNHWHALATIWACQAGKEVYVEKPASYSIWEGRQMVAAARKHQRIVQVGTQSRSNDVSQQAVEYIQSGKLGKIQYAHAIIYRRRESIGRVSGPQPVPPTVDYDRWLGPAPMTRPMRNVFHYDWHWVWATGNGEIGNNGVHYLDRCRWHLGQDKLPSRAMSVGGRFLFNDDGETANTQIAILDYDPAPILCEVRNLAEKPGSKKMDTHRSLTSGIIIQCEDGAYVSSRGKSVIVDRAGNEVKVFESRLDPEVQRWAHQANFFDAIRSRKSSDLNVDVREGHLSAALCHMANVSYRLGKPARGGEIVEATSGNAQLADAIRRTGQHLETHGVDVNVTPATLGPWVTMDPQSEQFVGQLAEEANQLSRREYRAPYVVPELV